MIAVEQPCRREAENSCVEVVLGVGCRGAVGFVVDGSGRRAEVGLVDCCCCLHRLADRARGSGPGPGVGANEVGQVAVGDQKRRESPVCGGRTWLSTKTFFGEKQIFICRLKFDRLK